MILLKKCDKVYSKFYGLRNNPGYTVIALDNDNLHMSVKGNWESGKILSPCL